MKYQTNLRVLLLVHVIGMILLGVLFCFDTASKSFVKGLFAAVLFSLLVQLLIYHFKPGWLNNKITKHPDRY